MRLMAALACLMLATTLSRCVWFRGKLLGERFYVEGMTNPKTGEHITCGNFVQKGEITNSEIHALSACVAEHAAQGFILDKSPSPQPSPPEGERE